MAVQFRANGITLCKVVEVPNSTELGLYFTYAVVNYFVCQYSMNQILFVFFMGRERQGGKGGDEK